MQQGSGAAAAAELDAVAAAELDAVAAAGAAAATGTPGP